MLDVIADRVKIPASGLMWLNGKRKTEHSLRQLSKYVQQDDCLLGSLTCKEVLRTAAALYISDSSKREALIDATLKMVGLQNQVDTKVGDVFFRGLSGGQKRRLSIAVELLAQPSILFLDEPLSGLDSAAAFSIMESLRKVAKASGTSLIITIHQPSELLFEMCDHLLLLSGGKQVFFGPVHQVESHFQRLGFECPKRTSVAEWVLDLINRDFGSDTVVDKCISGWKGCDAYLKMQDDLKSLGVPEKDDSAKPSDPIIDQYAVSQFAQTWALFSRQMLVSLRAPQVIWLRFGLYFMLAILIGTIWLLLGNSAKVINDINGMLFYTVAFMIFMSISSLPAYLEERSMLGRERGNRAYSIGSYLIAHLLAELPFLFLLSLVCSATVYWLVGLYPEPNRFFICTNCRKHIFWEVNQFFFFFFQSLQICSLVCS